MPGQILSESAGVFDVYVQPFPATGTRWQISHGGGQQPVWAPDTRELFYIAPDKKMVSVAITTSATGFTPGASRVLVDTRVEGWERTNRAAPTP